MSIAKIANDIAKNSHSNIIIVVEGLVMIVQMGSFTHAADRLHVSFSGKYVGCGVY
ncbi:MAG: LysR family transcriptional regulator [Oceanospirillaceae bacterium]|nr:LysR family transcriptional regulator [Oceanospirillaceae bacterium]